MISCWTSSCGRIASSHAARTRPPRISVSAGGQGANVAAWVAELGATARWLGSGRPIPPGRLAAEQLAADGVELGGPVEPVRNGVIVSLVESGGERSMFPDRGVAAGSGPTSCRPEWLALRPPPRLRVRAARGAGRVRRARAVELAREHGARVSVDLSSWSTIRAAGAKAFRALVDHSEPDVVFANEDEERVFGGRLPGVAWISSAVHAAARSTGTSGRRSRSTASSNHGRGRRARSGIDRRRADLALEAAARCVPALGSMP